MKIHNKNIIIMMIISIFVLITTSLVNINLSAKKINENEVKKLNFEILMYKEQVKDFYKTLNKHSVFLGKNYIDNDIKIFNKIVQNLIITETLIKSGELYYLNTKKLTFVGNPTNYISSDWISEISKDKREKIILIDDRVYYMNVLKNKNKIFAYIAFEIDKRQFNQVFFTNSSYFILDENKNFIKNDFYISQNLLNKLKDFIKSPNTINESKDKNSYIYYSYIEELDWIIGLKGEYLSSKEKFLLIKNFSISSIIMIIIFGLLGLKSNKDNITKPIALLTNFLKNSGDKTLIKNIEIKENTELNELVLAFNEYTTVHDKKIIKIKKSYNYLYEINNNLIKKYIDFFKKNKSDFFKKSKQEYENNLKILLGTERLMNLVLYDFQTISDKILLIEKKSKSFNSYNLNVIKIVEDNDNLFSKFENGTIDNKEFLIELRIKNKKLLDSASNFSALLTKTDKIIENIKSLEEKIQINKRKIDLSFKALKNMYIKKDVINQKDNKNIEKLENIEELRNEFFSEINGKIEILNRIKVNLDLFKEIVKKI